MFPSFSARDFMNTKLITFSPNIDVTDAIHELVRNEISGAPVVDQNGRVVGILTERDCLDVFLKASYHGEPAGPVSEFMSCDVQTVESETGIFEIAQRLARTKYRRYPVVEAGRLVGLISRRDILQALLEASSRQP